MLLLLEVVIVGGDSGDGDGGRVVALRLPRLLLLLLLLLLPVLLLPLLLLLLLLLQHLPGVKETTLVLLLESIHDVFALTLAAFQCLLPVARCCYRRRLVICC